MSDKLLQEIADNLHSLSMVDHENITVRLDADEHNMFAYTLNEISEQQKKSNIIMERIAAALESMGGIK